VGIITYIKKEIIKLEKGGNMDVQKLKRGYKLKLLISLMYIVLLFIAIDLIFMYTPLNKIAYVDTGSTTDIFFNQLSSFIMYMVIIVFFTINFVSLRKYRENMEFYEIKEDNPNDSRIKGISEPRGCGIWNPIC
jgi:ABC-type transport system involved in multi-copper enzyme maturation permease subunit